MKLVYDVETSGLPDWKKPSNDPSQPHIIQVAAILIDGLDNEIKRMNEYVKPDGWELPAEITTLTGITQEKLMAEGKPIADVVAQFIEMWRLSDQTIAHNDSFDRRLFRIEMARLFGKVDLLEEWKIFPAFCTMLHSTNIVKCPPTEKMVKAAFGKFKAPKLEEAYEFFHGEKPKICHDAMADVETTLAVYKKIQIATGASLQGAA
jgi:DNA polymerase-3 subunit epsilon